MKESRDACLFRALTAFAARGSTALLLGFLSNLVWAPLLLLSSPPPLPLPSTSSLSLQGLYLARLSTFGLGSDQGSSQFEHPHSCKDCGDDDDDHHQQPSGSESLSLDSFYKRQWRAARLIVSILYFILYIVPV